MTLECYGYFAVIFPLGKEPHGPNSSPVGQTHTESYSHPRLVILSTLAFLDLVSSIAIQVVAGNDSDSTRANCCESMPPQTLEHLSPVFPGRHALPELQHAIPGLRGRELRCLLAWLSLFMFRAFKVRV